MAGKTILTKETILNIVGKNSGSLFRETQNFLQKSLSHLDTKPKKEMTISFSRTRI
jgi:hypothetical protein